MKLSQQKLPIYALYWVNFVLLIICAPAASEERYDEQQNYCSHHRGQQRAECSRRNPAPQPHEPAAQESAYDADNQIDNKPRAVASNNHIGYPAGDKTNEQIP